MKELIDRLKKEAEEFIASGKNYDERYEEGFGKGMMRVIDAITSPEAREKRMLAKAGDFLCDSDEGITVAEQVERIRNHKNEYDFIDSVDGVMVWEKCGNLTCTDFIDLIESYGQDY